jgi:hypothetical protein
VTAIGSEVRNERGSGRISIVFAVSDLECTLSPTCVLIPIAVNEDGKHHKQSLALTILNACDTDPIAAQHVAAHLVREASVMNVKASWDHLLTYCLGGTGFFPPGLLKQKIQQYVSWDEIYTHTRFSMVDRGCAYRVAFTDTWHCVYTLASSESKMRFVFVCAGFFFAAAMIDGSITLAVPGTCHTSTHPSNFALTHGTLSQRVHALISAYNSFEIHRTSLPAYGFPLSIFCLQCYTTVKSSIVGKRPIETCKACRTFTMQAIEVYLVPDLARMVSQYLSD